MADRTNSFASNRLEAFSDGVFAILITIMVLSIHTPSGHHFSDLTSLRPVLLSYLLSFIYLMIYWNNHHHLLKTVESPNGWVMWANSNLLFWLSLVPFSTAWLGTSEGAKAPAVIYGISLLLPAIAYYLLQISIVKTSEGGSVLKSALGRDLKGKLSPLLYAVAIGFAFIAPIVSYIIYAAVAVMWIIPDRRISRNLNAI